MPPEKDASERFALGAWTVFPERDLLVRRTHGRRVERRMTPLETRLLLRLAATPGRLVTKDELFRDVWNDAAVVAHVLPKAISKLRASLGDDARAPRFVQTVGRRGYRLIATPRALAGSTERIGQQHPGRFGSRRGLLTATAVAGAFVAGLLLQPPEPPTQIEIRTSSAGPTNTAPTLDRIDCPVRISIPAHAIEDEAGLPFRWSFAIDTR